MASGSGSSDELGREERVTAKSLGKATQEKEMNLESQLGATAPTLNGEQDCTISKGKQVVPPFEDGHHSNDKNIQSSTSWIVGSFQDGNVIYPSHNAEECIIALGPSSSSSKSTHKQDLQEEGRRSKTDGPHPGLSNLQDVAASVAPDGPPVVEADVPIVVCDDLVRAEPHVRSTVGACHGAALTVASPNMVLNQPRIAPNVAPNVVPVVAPTLVRTDVAHFGEAPVQLDVAPDAQRNGGPPVPPQPNAALIAVANAQANAAEVDAFPLEFDIDLNEGLKHSRVRPLRICDIESEGHIWSKLPRS